MSEVKKYTIRGVNFTQEELNIGQDIDLALLVAEITGDVDWTDLPSVIRALGPDKVKQLLGIILDGDLDSIDVIKLKNSELEAVVVDFLALNESVTSKLQNFFGGIREMVTPMMETPEK